MFLSVCLCMYFLVAMLFITLYVPNIPQSTAVDNLLGQVTCRNLSSLTILYPFIICLKYSLYIPLEPHHTLLQLLLQLSNTI